jgi:hypothetical protein
MADQFEYRLNSEYPTKRMPVPFTPEVVFIYNPSNAWLYLNTTTYAIPTTTQYDMSIPPNSYTIFVPYTPNTEYGGLLVVPGGGAIEWDCWVEFRKGEKELDWNVKAGFPVIQPLSPLPDPAVSAAFTWADVAALGNLWDFTISDFGFYDANAPNPGVYSPGVGWVSALQIGNVQDQVSIVSPTPSTWSGSVTEIGMGYQDNHAANTTNRQLFTSINNNVSPPASESITNNTTSHGAQFYSGFLPGVVTAIRAGASLVNTDPTPPNTSGDLIIQYLYIRGTFTVQPDTGEAIYISVQFVDASTGAIAQWFWDFGDGQSSTLQNPVNVYNYAGVYTVTLVVVGAFGEVSFTQQVIYVNAVAPIVLAFI